MSAGAGAGAAANTVAKQFGHWAENIIEEQANASHRNNAEYKSSLEASEDIDEQILASLLKQEGSFGEQIGMFEDIDGRIVAHINHIKTTQELLQKQSSYMAEHMSAQLKAGVSTLAEYPENFTDANVYEGKEALLELLKEREVIHNTWVAGKTRPATPTRRGRKKRRSKGKYSRRRKYTRR